MRSKHELHELAQRLRDPEAAERDGAGRRRPSRNWLWGLAAVMAVAAAIWVWRGGGAGEPVESTVADHRRLGPAAGAILRSTGFVDYPDRPMVSAQVAGRVRRLHVQEGDRVEPGDTLATLDDEQAKIRVDLARLAVDRASAALLEIESRWRAGSASSREVERARIERETALQQERLARTELGLHQITSPVAGRVLSVSTRVGELATGSMMELADTGRAWIRTDVRQEDVPLVRPGGHAVAILEEDPDIEWAGRVDGIAPVADRAGNTVEVRIRLLPPLPFLRPELTASVMFTEQGRVGHGRSVVVLSVEERFIRETDGTSWVWLQREGRVERREIRTGAASHGLVEIVEGLSVGDVVVRPLQGELEPGAKVRVAQSE